MASVGLARAEKKTENFSNLNAADSALQSLCPFVWGESKALHIRNFNPGGSLNPFNPLSPPDPDEDEDPNLRWCALWSSGLGSLAVTSRWMVKVARVNSLGNVPYNNLT